MGQTGRALEVYYNQTARVEAWLWTEARIASRSRRTRPPATGLGLVSGIRTRATIATSAFGAELPVSSRSQLVGGMPHCGHCLKPVAGFSGVGSCHSFPAIGGPYPVPCCCMLNVCFAGSGSLDHGRSIESSAVRMGALDMANRPS